MANILLLYEELLDKCERDNKIAPLRHACQRGPKEPKLQFFSNYLIAIWDTIPSI